MIGVFALYGLSALILWPTEQTVPVVAALIPLLVWISHSDQNTFTIPDLAVALLASLGCINGALSGYSVLIANAGAAVLIATPLALLGEWIWARRSVDVLGLGDVKLIGAGVLVVGSSSVWLMILLASTGGIVAALLAGHRRQHGIPFGPFIAYAIFITFLITDPNA